MESFAYLTAIIGLVEAFRRLIKLDWKAVLTIALAGAVGSLFKEILGVDLFNASHPNWFEGLVAGFGAAGTVTLAKVLGVKRNVKDDVDGN